MYSGIGLMKSPRPLTILCLISTKVYLIQNGIANIMSYLYQRKEKVYSMEKSEQNW